MAGGLRPRDRPDVPAVRAVPAAPSPCRWIVPAERFLPRPSPFVPASVLSTVTSPRSWEVTRCVSRTAVPRPCCCSFLLAPMRQPRRAAHRRRAPHGAVRLLRLRRTTRSSSRSTPRRRAARGLPVSVQHGIGTREVVSPALQQGVVDVVVDDPGTALAFARPGVRPPAGSPSRGDARGARPDSWAPEASTSSSRPQPRTRTASSSPTPSPPSRTWTPLSDLVAVAPTDPPPSPGLPECPDRPFWPARPGAGLRPAVRRGPPACRRAGATPRGAALPADRRRPAGDDRRPPRRRPGDRCSKDDRALQPRENVVPMVRAEAARALGRAAAHVRWRRPSSRLTTEPPDRAQPRGGVADGRTPAQAAASWWDTQ